MKRALLVAALVALVGACGDDHLKVKPDGGPGIDAPIDGPVSATTLTSYVIDLVQHHTSDTELPRAYSEFQALPDPDSSNGSAYSSLF